MIIQLETINEIIEILSNSRDSSLKMLKKNRHYPVISGVHKHHASGLDEAIKTIIEYLELDKTPLRRIGNERI